MQVQLTGHDAPGRCPEMAVSGTGRGRQLHAAFSDSVQHSAVRQQ